jgi:cytochrome c oxidase assembly factor CtaG
MVTTYLLHLTYFCCALVVWWWIIRCLVESDKLKPLVVGNINSLIQFLSLDECFVDTCASI